MPPPLLSRSRLDTLFPHTVDFTTPYAAAQSLPLYVYLFRKLQTSSLVGFLLMPIVNINKFTIHKKESTHRTREAVVVVFP